eukprot:9423756-Lingulodinium_polyedra.AAC.1
MPPSLFTDFATLLNAPDAMHFAKVGSHLRSLLVQAHDCSWFTLQGVDGPTEVNSGSKAGDPL